MKCEKCKYYVAINNDDHGVCYGTFVEVYPDDECLWGEVNDGEID